MNKATPSRENLTRCPRWDDKWPSCHHHAGPGWLRFPAEAVFSHKSGSCCGSAENKAPGRSSFRGMPWPWRGEHDLKLRSRFFFQGPPSTQSLQLLDSINDNGFKLGWRFHLNGQRNTGGSGEKPGLVYTFPPTDSLCLWAM